MTDLEIREITDSDEKSTICDSVISALPAWFGDPEANEEYITDVKEIPLFVAHIGAETCGFVALNSTSPNAVDIHVLGVAQDRHNQGIGKALIATAQEYAVSQGAVFLTVKTLGPSFENEAYAKTHQFYYAVGFVPLEEHLDYWGEGVPCLQMCKWIGP